MQNWNIIPYKGIGDILFGGSRNEIRRILSNLTYEEFYKTPDSKNSTDYYTSIGIFIYYTANNLCEAIEFCDTATPLFEHKNLLYLNYKDLLGWLNTIDTEIEEDDYGFTSYQLGIGCYAPEKEENFDCLPESIIIFRYGYYD